MTRSVNVSGKLLKASLVQGPKGPMSFLQKKHQPLLAP